MPIRPFLHLQHWTLLLLLLAMHALHAPPPRCTDAGSASHTRATACLA